MVVIGRVEDDDDGGSGSGRVEG
ncbi:uncharacterized protein G2W53_020504 [Senna tora]|uniref:Uncharacterized protein n=1 Tax=Senna tora TaxID=362788 RepID=A0A834WMY9_9FABA|nr:uncharacterized protein G2W53_020504 [Senna tora]